MLTHSGPYFVDYISDTQVDIAVITETWLKSVDAAAKIDATPTGCRLFDSPHPDRLGRGTGILVWDSLHVKQVRVGSLVSFEYSEWVIFSDSFRLCLLVIYRPPYSSNHPVTMSVFIAEFAKFLESVVMATKRLIITSDFNIHVNVHSNDSL